MPFFFHDRKTGQTYSGTVPEYVGLAANGGRPAVGVGQDYSEPVLRAPARWADDGFDLDTEERMLLQAEAVTSLGNVNQWFTVSEVLSAHFKAEALSGLERLDFTQTRMAASLAEDAQRHLSWKLDFRPKVGESPINTARLLVGLPAI